MSYTFLKHIQISHANERKKNCRSRKKSNGGPKRIVKSADLSALRSLENADFTFLVISTDSFSWMDPVFYGSDFCLVLRNTCFNYFNCSDLLIYPFLPLLISPDLHTYFSMVRKFSMVSIYFTDFSQDSHDWNRLKALWLRKNYES